jgi:membrane associated rhomboid family serine protease
MERLALAPVTFALLAVNVGLSLYVLFGRGDLFERYALTPHAVLRRGEWDRVIVSAFLHVGLGHLAFNMISLYAFGPILEQLLGHWRFGVLYAGSQLASAALTLWLRRGDANYSAVGASGAISGVIFAFCLFAPFEKIYIMFALPMPALVFAVLYVVGSIWAMRQAQREGVTGGVAHEAHLGGALGGVLITIALVPGVVGYFLSEVGLAG